MNDVNKLASELIKALTKSTDQAINLLGIQRRNSFEDMANRSNKQGTLYSGARGAQQSRFDGTSYIPAVAQARNQLTQQKITIKGDVLDTKRKIAAMNRAAKELNGISFKALLE